MSLLAQLVIVWLLLGGLGWYGGSRYGWGGYGYAPFGLFLLVIVLYLIFGPGLAIH